eukprot:GILK01012236.1.p1 GENE.GILK01012236.1~~GILK01012236.1.p1  ORF type:complete len:278 (+),score=35.99 GILK01012236.1:28-834(+)
MSKFVRIDRLLVAGRQILSRNGAKEFLESNKVMRKVLVKQADGSDAQEFVRVSTASERVDPLSILLNDQELDRLPLHGVVLPPMTLAVHKPVGHLSSNVRKPPEAPVVYDLVPEEYLLMEPPLNIVARLHENASGLLLLSQDGTVQHRLTSPKRPVERTYEVVVAGSAVSPMVSREDLRALTGGAHSPCQVQILQSDIATKQSTLLIKLQEEKYDQVRKMVELIGKQVVSLKRTAIGALSLSDLQLPEGSYRALSEQEIAAATLTLKQ